MMSDEKRSRMPLRSEKWFESETIRGFYHRSRTKQMGFSEEDYRSKPVIAIINTWSDLNPCHHHFRDRAEDVKRGVYQAGGFPVELPAMALGEMFMKPTTMMYRNMLAMEVEELLRANPIDGAVLLGGCDKTVPAMIMGASSMGLPFIFVPAGAMLRGNWRGRVLGSGTDQAKAFAERRAGNLSDADWFSMEEGSARSVGTCNTMGTASTMAAIAETLGISLPGAASIPAVDASHQRMAAAAGRRIVKLVEQDIRPSSIMTPDAFHNAIVALMALGGSTNAIIHLVAMAKRLGHSIDLEYFDKVSRTTPFLANLAPSGKYLMEDFYAAGGLQALLVELKDMLNTECISVNGLTLADNIADAQNYNDDVIRRRDNPVSGEGGLVVLKGNLAPNGAVIKQTAMDARLRKHKGPAVVFNDYKDFLARVDSPDLPVTADSILVMRNCGPLGGPGMPEWGNMPIPKKLLQQGVRDLIRISDCRMSGTTFGACVLHVSPEAFIGGPLAIVRDGDLIELDISNRRLHLDISDGEMSERLREWVRPEPKYSRSYGALFSENVAQADQGCDFKFLQGTDCVPDPQV